MQPHTRATVETDQRAKRWYPEEDHAVMFNQVPNKGQKTLHHDNSNSGSRSAWIFAEETEPSNDSARVYPTLTDCATTQTAQEADDINKKREEDEVKHTIPKHNASQIDNSVGINS